MTTAERLTAVAENVAKVYEAGKAAGGLPDGDMTNPDYVYAVTRPKDWLPMPRPGDNEIFCLGQLLPEIGDLFFVSAEFAECTIEFGQLVNGSFMAKESLTPLSGTPCYKQLEYTDYGDELPDGCRQYMVRIQGTGFSNVSFTPKDVAFGASNLVEISSGVMTRTFKVGAYNSPEFSVNCLRYLSFVGNGCPGHVNGETFIGGCQALLCVRCEADNTRDTLKYGTYAAYKTPSLMAISNKIFSNVTNDMSSTFRHCRALFAVSLSNTPTKTDNMFRESGLHSFSSATVNTSKSASLSGMFNDCQALSSATGLNLTAATSTNDLFANCYSLAKLTFAGETTPGGWAISLTDTCLSHKALVEMIVSLPTATAAATITITGVPGASELTDAEIAVATAKNWTITR